MKTNRKLLAENVSRGLKSLGLVLGSNSPLNNKNKKETNIMNTEMHTATATSTATDTTLDLLVANVARAEEAIEAAKENHEAALKALVSIHGSTFEHNARWYQVRTRLTAEGTLTYLCSLKGAPSTWLKGRPKGVKNKVKKSGASLSQKLANVEDTMAENAEDEEVTAGDTVMA